MNSELITALVDDEIESSEEKTELLEKIESDSDLKYDYMVQSFIKRIVREKVEFKTTPEPVKQKVLKKLQKEIPSGKKQRKPFTGFLSKPAFTFATAAVVVLALVLIILNRPAPVEPKNFALEQLGEDNMFVQAKNNFNSIIQGKLQPQITTSDADQIKNYFEEQGVKYSTVIPQFNELNLLGAVVSEDKGEKFAHHVYTDEQGKLVYLFQVEESYFETNEIIKLTDDLLAYLNEGNCFTSKENDYGILMTKSDDKIIAVVSNVSLSNLENKFCNLTSGSI